MFSNSKTKPKRLSRLEVSEFMVKNNIHRATELYAAAEERRKEGQTDLAAFALSCTKKSLNDFIETYMSTLPQILGVSHFIDAKQTSRTQLLKQRESPRLL